MSQPLVWAFFYGSFINFEVLKQSGFVPERFEVARLNGFEIRIQPLATVIHSNQHCVYGIVVPATHEDLRRIYSQDWVGAYLPEEVLVQTLDGKWRPAFCYIAPATEVKPATNEYIDRMVGPAKKYGFPDWYIARIESFRPSGG